MILRPVRPAGIDDDLAASEAGVAHRAADLETPGRIDVELGVLADPFRRQYRLYDFVHDAFPDFAVTCFRSVLGGQHDRVDRDRLVVLVDEGHLALGVRAQPGQGAVLANLRLAAHEQVSVGNRGRHEHVGLVGGVTEHHALVAGALFLRCAPIDTLGDIV
jgi:hypothetical protein